jgi:hypothetical protein
LPTTDYSTLFEYCLEETHRLDGKVTEVMKMYQVGNKMFETYFGKVLQDDRKFQEQMDFTFSMILDYIYFRDNVEGKQ